MQEARRRQILSDMGIALWQLRAPEPIPETEPIRVAEPVPEPEPEPVRAEPTAAPAAPVCTAPAPAPEADKAIVPWSVLSLAQGDAVLLVEADSSRRDLRLARDVLAAATGHWQGKPVSRRFDWPPAVPGQGVLPSAEDGRRAFNAFVHKDLGDHGAALLLCIAPLAEALPESIPGCRRVVIPALSELGRDAAGKRALWRTIRDSRR